MNQMSMEMIAKALQMLVVIIVGTLVVQGVGAQSIQFTPPSPKALESVWARFQPTRSSTGQIANIRLSGQRITVSFDGMPVGTFPPQPPRTIYLGQLPAGTYEVVFVEPDATTTTGALTIADGGADTVATGYQNSLTDLWWNSQESGWGDNITVKRGKLFAAWFVYDSAGRAAWLTLQPGAWITLNCFRGPIYRTTASPMAGIVGLSNLGISEVGTGKFCFNDDMNSAVFSYTVDGVANEKNITRQPF